MTTQLTTTQTEELLAILQTRFEDNPRRHPSLEWEPIARRLQEKTGPIARRTGGSASRPIPAEAPAATTTV